MTETVGYHPAFEAVRSEFIPTLNLTLQEFRHIKTGARHLHLAADQDENAFLVAFLTVPQDSTGVAHILEHTALCGSERFPVRDPFFMMLRRSLNTFMNAFTSSDWTAYPFASQNKKDFNNLLEVYLDAAFFPSLDRLDFAQEGHRLAPVDLANPEGEWAIKGVVFNEMKGAMSSPTSALWQELQTALFPTTTYHHNSGGDPAEIPNLTWAQLKAFHATHYHPSNAIFMTFGNIPAAEHQATMERLALSRFERLDGDWAIPDERRQTAPSTVEARYPLDEEEEEEGGEGGGLAEKTHIVLGWLLGRCADPLELLESHLLTGILLDNSASPLRHVLETSDLGTGPSPVCGLDDSIREMVFAAGVEGSEPEHAQAVEDLVLGVLNEVAHDGVDPELVESVLHQLELSQREITGDRFPYGLQLILRALTPALHGGDPAQALEIDPILKTLRSRIEDPAYIPGLVRRLLLDNPHRVRLTMQPDPDLSRDRMEAEQTKVAEQVGAMSAEERQGWIELNQALEERQNRQDDPGTLPKVGIEDIPAGIKVVEGEQGVAAGMPLTRYAQGTNGLVYEQAIVELPDLPDELVEWLPLYTDLLTEVGVDGRSYRETQAWQALVSGGIHASCGVRSAIDDLDRTKGFFVLSAKALDRNGGAMTELLERTFSAPRFDERERLGELVSQLRSMGEESVVRNGHQYAMNAASQGMSPSAALDHRWSGLASIQELKRLDKRLSRGEGIEAFSAGLSQIHQALIGAPRRLLLIGEAGQIDPLQQTMDRQWGQAVVGREIFPFAPKGVPTQVRQAWLTSTDVSFCAKAYPGVAVEHPDAAPLMVLAGVLRNGFLHRAIREQGGAYGGGANYSSDAGAFRFYSYRDPRLSETLADFDRAIEWVASGDLQWRQVEESILGLIASMDKPGSPAGEAKKGYHAALHGRTPMQRMGLRRRVLAVNVEDLRRVAATYLQPEHASTAVVTSRSILDNQGSSLDLNPVVL
ncbi:MAG: peptidase M16 [Alphaproteobacteria bacterium CG_4_10_14_0_2_um_filter_63_37]|nr:MAG: peptidase M16 [Proteobacteria bacterium CG1_02_64_396]PJA24151.1 MAG: peptidase M16 [Alphaproteobacteria bacterium CG_4_10_14_0_2_um_filter_63_37]